MCGILNVNTPKRSARKNKYFRRFEYKCVNNFKNRKIKVYL